MSGDNSREKSRIFFTIHVAMDILLVCLGFNIVFAYMRFYTDNFNVSSQQHIEILILIAVLALVFFQIYGVFRCGRRPYAEIALSALLSLAFVNAICIALTTIFQVFQVPVVVFLISFALQLILIAVWKMVVYRIYPVFYKPKTAIFIGNGSGVYKLAEKVLRKDKNMFELKHLCDKMDENIDSKIDEVDVVFISPDVDNNYKQSIMYHCMGLGKTVYLIPELFEIALFNAKMSRFDDVPALCIENLHMSLEQKFLKRAFDLSVSLFLIILSLPIMLITYIAIKVYDRGPALFSQERVTRFNKQFKLYKFRTMIVDAEKKTGPVLATDKDNRITPMGRFLRATRIDELPQLFNVMFGDMSIVGPRPERQFFIDQFKAELPDFEYRLAVKSGITGLAQVLGKYTTTPQDKLRFDLLYIRNYSFLLDLKIIFQTVKIMFMKASSQGVVKEEKVPDFVKRQFSEAINKN